jgi:homoserine dehydrogenase
VIKAMREGLAANRINWLAGIINGTGNFILTEMREKGRDFRRRAQAEAQALGYAEADPTFDVEGIDAAHKLTILAPLPSVSRCSSTRPTPKASPRLTSADVAYAEALGYRIKHLGIARRTEAGIELRVHPTLIPSRPPDRQRQRRDERGDGQWRRGRQHTVTTAPAPAWSRPPRRWSPMWLMWFVR